MKRGEVWLAHFPFTDDSSTKLRPVLVVSADRLNSGEDVVVVPISSRPDRDDPYSIYLEPSDAEFAATGLRFPSAIKWTKPMAISKRVITRRLGKLSQARIDEVCESVASLFS
jgi:mRNA interferase MazF